MKIDINKKIFKRLFGKKIQLRDQDVSDALGTVEEPEENLFNGEQIKQMLSDQESEIEFDFLFHEKFHDLPQEEDDKKRGK